VHEVGDNHADDILRKSCGRGGTRFGGVDYVAGLLRNPSGEGRSCGRGDSLVGDLLRGPGGGVRTPVRGLAQKGGFLNSGQALVPDMLSEQFNCCSGKRQVVVVKQSPRRQIVEVPDCEDEGDCVGIVLLRRDNVTVGRLPTLRLGQGEGLLAHENNLRASSS